MALPLNPFAAAAQRGLGVRLDPFKAYNFFVEVGGILVGGFTSVSGLQFRNEYRTVREGGVNDFEHRLPGQTTYTEIVLETGMTALDPMWLWYRATQTGNIRRENGSIYLLDDQGIPAVWWNFYNAWPVEWQGPSLDASQTLVAGQRIVLAHERVEKSATAAAVSAAAGVASGILGKL